MSAFRSIGKLSNQRYSSKMKDRVPRYFEKGRKFYSHPHTAHATPDRIGRHKIRDHLQFWNSRSFVKYLHKFVHKARSWVQIHCFVVCFQIHTKLRKRCYILSYRFWALHWASQEGAPATSNGISSFAVLDASETGTFSGTAHEPFWCGVSQASSLGGKKLGKFDLGMRLRSEQNSRRALVSFFFVCLLFFSFLYGTSICSCTVCGCLKSSIVISANLYFLLWISLFSSRGKY